MPSAKRGPFTLNAAPTFDNPAWLTDIDDAAYRFSNDVVNVKERDYGALGNGSTNDSTAFANAASDAAGKPIYAPAGTYRLTTTPFTSTTPITLIGAGKGQTIFQIEGVPLATTTGSIGSAVNITVSVVVGATTLTMTSTTGISAGDYLILKDAGQVLAGTNDSAYAGHVGEVVRVKSVDSGTVVTLYGECEQAMTASGSNVQVRKLTLVNGFCLENCTVRNPNPATYTGAAGRGLDIKYIKNVHLRNVEFSQLDDDGARLESCIGFRVENCDFNDMTNTGGRTPYGVHANNATVDGIIAHCRQRGGRHLFTTGGADSEIGPAHILVSHCQGMESTSAPFDTHPAGRYITFSHCESHAQNGVGWGNIRSPKTRVLNARCVGGSAAVGINLGGTASECIVDGGQIRGVSVGVNVEAEDTIVERMQISGTTRGVRVRANIDNDVGKAAITKARIRDIEIVGNPSTAGVQLEGTETVTKIAERIYAPDATTPITPAIPTITAASALTLPIGPNVIAISGNTNITSVSAAGQVGRMVTLKFAGTPTFTDGSNLKLAGNFVAAGTTNDHDTITIVCDGTNWYEVSRSTN
jgi:hypothetical protein